MQQMRILWIRNMPCKSLETLDKQILINSKTTKRKKRYSVKFFSERPFSFSTGTYCVWFKLVSATSIKIKLQKIDRGMEEQASTKHQAFFMFM